MELPTDVATVDEVIPELRDRPWDGPDMRSATSIDEMLSDLTRQPSPQAYAGRWIELIESIGCDVSVMYEQDGEEQLVLGRPCDAQLRHRARWLHFLCQDLKTEPDRRGALISIVLANGRYTDNRPADLAGTTTAMRAFLAAGGRILIDPKGELIDPPGLPPKIAHGTDDVYGKFIEAGRAFYRVRRRWRNERHIKRAVRRLGARTDNGWIVLDAG